MLKFVFTSLFLTTVSASLLGQTFKGKVVNQNNVPLENVYVINATQNEHTHTDAKGNFILEKNKENDTISISILGFEKKVIRITQNQLTNFNTIQLQPKSYLLDELVLTAKKDPLVSMVAIDVQKNPVSSSQEILQTVPGLIIGQHAGGGKAEQIFLRGFDIDHGTDIALSVDGLPINMVSHAHGQGYSDLHFIIPETINKINFGKGPYEASKGDFATAGFVDFSTKTRINKSSISLDVGQFNSFRTLAMLNLLDNSSTNSAYAAIEYQETDGFFESSQNFSRLNIFGKYQSVLEDNSKLTLSASYFTSTWDASGQIPQRAVDSGLISRFGAIDDTEGGTTSRTNINLQHSKFLKNDVEITSNIFYSNYKFNLFSNFTFFLDDPDNGDQIKQTENRDIFGFNTQLKKQVTFASIPTSVRGGAGFRFDNINDLELSHTLQRKEVLDYIQLGSVQQTNIYGFAAADLDLGKVSIQPSVRLDYFRFLYNDDLAPTYATNSNSEVVVNPKLSVVYTPNEKYQWFVKSGIGFHSNDARVVATNPNSKTLPKAYGVDVGGTAKLTNNLVVNAALWYLHSEDELVYVGDAGIVEPSGKSERKGIDFGVRYQLTKELYLNNDITLTDAKLLEVPVAENNIPLAPEFTTTGGIFYDNTKFFGGIKYRHLKDRAANEDYSLTAEGYTVVDANLGYRLKDFTFNVSALNLFDVAWNETQFATESRLQNEPNSVEEIHFTPGTPFNLKFTITYTF
ncbi:TonB-dependent receptor [Tenacibaculum geojense]|uniref:TonB-dependent receptor n=1 Tax=Tenacibaculum geojense TaxID=915352 RepID=A0ABW3JXG5_9FLAO